MRQIWIWHPKACLNPGQSVIRKLPKRPEESRSSYPAHCHIISNTVQPCAISSNHFRMCWRYLHTYSVSSQSYRFRDIPRVGNGTHPSLKINQFSVFPGFSGLCVQIQLKMATLTPGNTYMGVASFFMTWHLFTLINCPCWSTSLLLNPPKSPAFCPATLWSRRIGDLLTPVGPNTDNPLSATLNPMTVDSGLYNTHSSIKTTLWRWRCTDSVFLPLNNWAQGLQMQIRSLQLIELVGSQVGGWVPGWGKVTKQGRRKVWEQINLWGKHCDNG